MVVPIVLPYFKSVKKTSGLVDKHKGIERLSFSLVAGIGVNGNFNKDDWQNHPSSGVSKAWNSFRHGVGPSLTFGVTLFEVNPFLKNK